MPATQISTTDTAAVTAVLEGVYRAWESHDAGAFVADYVEDASVIMPGAYRTSREEIRQTMASGFASHLKGTTTINKVQSIRFLGEDAAVVISESGILFPGETQVPPNRLVNATWILERRSDRWLIVAYQNSQANLG